MVKAAKQRNPNFNPDESYYDEEFKKLDLNNDGRITLDEITRVSLEKAKASGQIKECKWDN